MAKTLRYWVGDHNGYANATPNPVDYFRLVFAYPWIMPRVLLNFDHYADWWYVHFIEADCKTGIGWVTRYYQFATVEGLRTFVLRCHPEDLEKFERSVRVWGRGSNYVHLSDEQYGKL